MKPVSHLLLFSAASAIAASSLAVAKEEGLEPSALVVPPVVDAMDKAVAAKEIAGAVTLVAD